MSTDTLSKEQSEPRSSGPNIPLSSAEQRILTLFPGATHADWEDWRWQIRNRIRTLEVAQKVFNLTDWFELLSIDFILFFCTSGSIS